MSGFQDLPETARDAIDRYHREGHRVKDWLASQKSMEWSKHNNEPTVANLVDASRLVKEHKVEVPQAIKSSAWVSYYERRDVNGWFKDQAARGMIFDSMDLKRHQHFTACWGEILGNLTGPLARDTSQAATSDQQNSQHPIFTNPWALLDDVATATHDTAATPTVTLVTKPPTSDEPVRQGYKALHEENVLLRAGKDYTDGTLKSADHLESFVKDPSARLRQAWVARLVTQLILRWAWTRVKEDHLSGAIAKIRQSYAPSQFNSSISRPDPLATSEASADVSLSRTRPSSTDHFLMASKLQQLGSITEVWQTLEMHQSLDFHGASTSDFGALDRFLKVLEVCVIEHHKQRPNACGGERDTLAFIESGAKWAKPGISRMLLHAEGKYMHDMPSYYISTLVLEMLYNIKAGAEQATLNGVNGMAILTDITFMSMSTYMTTGSFFEKGASDIDVTRLVLADYFASEIHDAVTLVLSLSDRAVHKEPHGSLFNTLRSFASSVSAMSGKGLPKELKPMLHSPLAIAHKFTLLNARCLELGEELWNLYHIVPSFLHLYNALRQMQLIDSVPIVDVILEHLLKAGGKGFMGGQLPKREFKKAYEVMGRHMVLKKREVLGSSGRVSRAS